MTTGATEAQVAAAMEALYDLIVDDPMWCDSVGRPLHYSSEREARIGEFLDKTTRAVADAVVAAGPDPATIAADALREAAVDVQAVHAGYPNNPRIRSLQSIRSWLRARADRIEAAP